MNYQEIDEYSEYRDALLKGDRSRCAAIVTSLLDRDVGVRTIYVDLFQRALYEVGDMWARNIISVDVEHYATAITESLFPLIYPRVFMAEHGGRRAVVSCVANEYHQVGGKMVSDILELHGWDARFLGAGSSTEQLVSEIADVNPDLVALSVSLPQNIRALQEAIDAVRRSFPELPIIVGGQAFAHLADSSVTSAAHVHVVRSLDALEGYIDAFG